MITIKWGTDKQKVLNSNCQVVNLIQYIQKVCGHENEEVDLAEEASGYLQFLKEIPGEYANQILKPRGVYIPVIVKTNEDGTISNLPLIDQNSLKQPFIVKSHRTAKTSGALKVPQNPVPVVGRLVSARKSAKKNKQRELSSSASEIK